MKKRIRVVYLEPEWKATIDMKIKTIFFLVLAFSIKGFSQFTGKYQKGSFLLQNADIYTMADGLIEGGDIRIAGDTIAAVGKDLIPEPGDSLVNCEGLWIMPGFIDCGTRLGLFEIGSISLTRDSRELGKFSPNLKALTAVNPNSVHIPVTRVNGVTTVLTVPEGGLFPGQAALINLVGYTPDQMSLGMEPVVMNFPSKPMLRGDRWDKVRKERYEESSKDLEEFWSAARAYWELWQKPDSTAGKRVIEPQFHALLPVFNREIPILVETNYAHDIIEALDWIKENNINGILTGVREGWRVADSIASAEIPVIVGPVLSMPTRSFDRYDRPYTNAAILLRAGVQVALRTNEAENVRNLPFNAGFAAAYGMGFEEALKSITINPARILGVDDKIGSLEAGKLANLLITDGDPFETKTQTVHLFIEGWKIPLESRQTLLYEEFLNRQPGLNSNE
jgi:imidazolonepropionase-like amidohydrolase